MAHIFLETIKDTFLSLPILFLCYLLLEYISTNTKSKNINFKKLNRIGPIVGSAVGLIPQCGFSVSAATLYNKNAIKGGTLIAVFLATSDEALPILIANYKKMGYILPLLILKFVFSCLFGYLLNLTIFKNQKLLNEDSYNVGFNSCEKHEHHHNTKTTKQIFLHALYHAVKTVVFIFVFMLIINLVTHNLSQDFFKNLFLNAGFLFPFITALIGLIPVCSVSVLLTQLFISGGISFAGLSAGAGIGFVALFKRKNKKEALKIIALCYIISALMGLILMLI